MNGGHGELVRGLLPPLPGWYPALSAQPGSRLGVLAGPGPLATPLWGTSQRPVGKLKMGLLKMGSCPAVPQMVSLIQDAFSAPPDGGIDPGCFFVLAATVLLKSSMFLAFQTAGTWPCFFSSLLVSL